MATWRRKPKRVHWGAQGLAWNTYEEGAEMAAGGGATTAYECSVQADRLMKVPVTKLRTECATVDDAQERLSRGESVVVAGSDMERLRQRLAAFGVA